MRGRRGVKMCQICDTLAIHEGCGACKLLKYTQADNIATVYHIGNHVCWVKLENRRVEKKEELFETYDCAQHLVTGKEMCINKVADYVSKGMVTEARQAASALKDFRKTKCTIERSNPLYHEDLNSFDAVGILKKKMDETDPFHIYRINNRSMNNGSDYVFKFLRFIAENIAVCMDINEPYNILQEENAYFDATHTRVHGFKSFGLWTYHPTMHQMI